MGLLLNPQPASTAGKTIKATNRTDAPQDKSENSHKRTTVIRKAEGRSKRDPDYKSPHWVWVRSELLQRN